MRRRVSIPSVLGIVAALGLIAAATGCAALRPVSAQGPGDGVCAPIAAGDPHVTIGTTFVSATTDAEIVGVELVGGDNLTVVGWRTRALEGTLNGAVHGFDQTDADHSVPAGAERYVEVGYALVDPTRDGIARAVRLGYRALGREGSTGATGVRTIIVPAGEDCATR